MLRLFLGIKNQVKKIFTSKRYATLLALFLCTAISLTIFLPSSQKKDNSYNYDYYVPMEKIDIESASTLFQGGIYIMQIHDFNAQSESFSADGYVWLKWKELDKGIDEWDPSIASAPIRTLQFINAVSQADLETKIVPKEPFLSKDGNYYQSVSFSGKFLSDINFKKFPFETIQLEINIEPEDFFHTEAIIDVSDDSSSGISSQNSLHGYKFQKMEVTSRKHIFNTSWGLTKESLDNYGDPNKTIYSNLVAKVFYKKDSLSTLFSYFLPLIAVMGIVLSSPLIETANADTKMGLPASA